VLIAKRLIIKMPRSPLKAEIAKELASELSDRQSDLGIRAGADPLHPLFRSNLITSFASWNLLDLWNHKDIKSACAHALEDYAASTASGRWLGGLNSRLISCEARSAQFISGESALLFSNKNQAILTLVTALATGGGVVLGPAMSALPLADACALVDLEFIECESHDDYQKAIERKQSASRIMVFAETVSAFTGKRLDLPKILALVNQHNCWLALDESWAIGHSGLRGAGSAETIPNSPQLLARFFSSHILSGSLVTALTCPHDVKELLLSRSRYLKIEPPPSLLEVAGLNAAIDLSELAITQRERLIARARTIHLALKEQGWRVISNDDSPIISIWFDTYSQANELQEALLQRGFLIDAISARSLKRNNAIARMIASVGHSDLEVSRLLDSLLEVKKRSV
jgi:7-keto-8-aminopelargonate synthetase-like enzyme